MGFNKDVLKLDCGNEVKKICSFIKQQLMDMRRDGIVVGLSGGLDSAVTASLCVDAVGREKVLGLILPEKDSNVVSEKYAQKEADRLGINTRKIDITPTLRAFGTYEKSDEVIKKIFPDYNSSYKFHITLPADLLKKDAFNFFKITLMDDKGQIRSSRLNKDQLNGIVAATDTKQRTRMMYLYYYAELKNYFVGGTTNKSEVIQGFFVKYGDGGVDIEPIAHLYKVQVYQLANHLGVIDEIIKRKPSPDTFSFIVSDEEFYFRIPYDKLDFLLYAWENNIVVSEVCKVMDLEEEQVKRAFRDFTSKYNATKHLRQLPPMLNV